MTRTTSPEAPKRLMIEADRVFDGERMRGRTRIDIEAGAITQLGAAGPVEDARVIRMPEGVIVAPGFIDVQVNGGGGALLNDAPTPFTLRRMVEAHRRYGTTGLLPTLITDGPEVMETLLQAVQGMPPMAGVLGFHLEGPHISMARKGIHPPDKIRPLTPRDRDRLAAFGALGRSQVTLAPECVSPADIAILVEAGLRVSIGHSDADAATVQRAAAAGATGVTHLYNAMSQLAGRAPGVVGVALTDDRLMAGIICDGHHVDPVSLNLAYRAKGRGGLMLVSDAMASLGADGDHFMLHGRRIELRDGRLQDAAGTLAGAHLGMIEAVKGAVSFMGASLRDALVMASLTPAQYLGLDNERGRIAVGYKADLVAFTPDFRVVETWIGGQPSQRNG